MVVGRSVGLRIGHVLLPVDPVINRLHPVAPLQSTPSLPTLPPHHRPPPPPPLNSSYAVGSRSVVKTRRRRRHPSSTARQPEDAQSFRWGPDTGPLSRCCIGSAGRTSLPDPDPGWFARVLPARDAATRISGWDSPPPPLSNAAPSSPTTPHHSCARSARR